MMTPEEARRVIQSHKFVENHFIYGVAKRQANRAINEVDTNIKNHTFMNNYIEKKYGYNMTGHSQQTTNPSGGVPSSGSNGMVCNHHHNQYNNHHQYQQQQQQQPKMTFQQNGAGGDRKYGVVYNISGFVNQKR